MEKFNTSIDINDTFRDIPTSSNLFFGAINDTFSDIANSSNTFFENAELDLIPGFKITLCLFGIFIFLSNLPVVISSGLFLKKGKEPKNTYLLMGNVSLADTILGISIVFIAIDEPLSSDVLCMIQLGTLVSPAMVSKFSVGLIAIDRYIYIIHGLYYKRWCNTTRVRICILISWIISITVGLIPLTGWTNKELKSTRCFYASLYPGAIILLNSLLSIIPIILVAILYSIILIKALRNLKQINASVKKFNPKIDEVPELRINRGNTQRTAQSVKQPNSLQVNIKRSASFNDGNQNRQNLFIRDCLTDRRIKSIDGLNKTETDSKNYNNRIIRNDYNSYDSELSIQTISSTIPEVNHDEKSKKLHRKPIIKDRIKWRAITIVMLTSGSFIITWMPFFITAIFFVFCEEKLTNPKCMKLRMLLAGPIALLAFLNSILNPLIYAWWHKGFKKNICIYFKRYFLVIFCNKNVQR